MRALILAVLLLTASTAAATEDWRWQAHWALAEHFDIALAPGLELESPTQELSLGRSTPGLPASLRNSTLRSTGRSILRVPRLGDPEPLVEVRGEGDARILAFARGGRGLLLLVDDPALGAETVLELRYRPAHEYPFRIGRPPRVRNAADAAGHAVMAHAGCFSCHSLYGRRQAGPSLDRETLVDRLSARLGSQAYRDRVGALDRSEDWALQQWREARAEVLAAEGHARLRAWMRWHLAEPSFDQPQARMPSMGLDLEQIETVSRFLLGSEPD